MMYIDHFNMILLTLMVGFLGAGIGIALFGTSAWNKAHEWALRDVRNGAIRAGVGHYEVDQATGKTSFVYGAAPSKVAPSNLAPLDLARVGDVNLPAGKRSVDIMETVDGVDGEKCSGKAYQYD